jgi:hypothetical protein
MTVDPLAAASQYAYVSLQTYLGAPDYSHQTLIDYVSPTTFTAAAADSLTVTVPPSTTDQTANLATLFPGLQAALFVAIIDITVPGQTFSVTTVSGGGRVAVAGSSWFAYMPNTTTLPTLYLTNPNTTTADLKILVLSN